MKITNNNVIKKFIISIILVIMLGNLAMPNYVQASVAGKLAEPIFSFITWIADQIMSFLQVNLGNGGDIVGIRGDYQISYSPGNIFANNIALFDINFVKPNKYKPIIEDGYLHIHDVDAGIVSMWTDFTISWGTLEDEFGLDSEFGIPTTPPTKTTYFAKKGPNKGIEAESPDEIDRQYEVLFIDWTDDDIHQRCYYEWTHNGIDYLLVAEWDLDQLVQTRSGRLYMKVNPDDYDVPSIATTLRSTVSKWYKAIRTLSLVGLLSVLVYIGIRVIISSSSEDKAKYKKMLGSWISAICIVFILHYIVVFILTLSEQLIEILKNNVSGNIGQDKIITNIRNQIGNSSGDDLLDVAAPVICYVVLIIYTCIFTIQYLKRVIYMAFLTIVAPLIALTYPLDKVKDGKAQAFSMWLKEYIFNALLQPVHLLLYVILIGGVAGDFIDSNPLYAIVAIGFLTPAEKFFRKMFGMESQTTVGAIEAAAGGAMVMSMLNKLKGKPANEEKEGKQGVRTASQNGGTRTATEPTGDSSNPTGPTQTGATQTGPTQTGPAQNTKPVQGQRWWQKAHELGKTHIYGTGSRARKNRRAIRRTITGAAGGILGATIGIAAGVASGDLGKAFSYGTAGAAAGYAGAKNLGDNISSKVQGAHDKIRKASMGTEAYNNAKFDEKFFESDDYKIFKEKHGENAKQIAQSYLNCGITDTKEMEKLIGSGIDANAYSQYKQNGVTDVAKMAELGKADISPELYGAFANEGITDIYKIKKAKKYAEGKKLNETQVAERMRIVQNVPEEAKNDEAKFGEYINRLARGKNWSQKEIEEMRKDLYKNLYDLT